MQEVHTSRFKDAPWYSIEGKDVIIGGAGGIGSWLCTLLSRAGFLPSVYDFDALEEHNLAGQLYSKKDAQENLSKVAALNKFCKDYCDTTINTFNEKYDENSMSGHYVFSAFDNMQARKDMFQNWCEYVKEWQEDNEGNTETPIFIDGRLTAEQLTIFCVTPDKIERYKEHLFDDSEVEEAPCTMKQTSHSAAMIASHMVAFFTNHITNVYAEDNVRNVPFYWEYFIPINYIEEYE